MNHTAQIVRHYHDYEPSTSIDRENSETVAAQLESHLDASTPNYHLENPIADDVDLDLTLSDSAGLNRNAPCIVAESTVTTQSQGLPDSDRSLQHAPSFSSRSRPLEQDNASSASTFAYSNPLNGAVGDVSPSEIETQLPVSKAEQARLIRLYLQRTGTWCETTDSGRHFTVTYVHKLMENKPFVAAAMVLASRQLDALRHSQSQTTLSLYQHAVRLLIHYDPSQCGEATLATCTLLSVYEMMASDVREWRRHLKVRLPARLANCWC